MLNYASLCLQPGDLVFFTIFSATSAILILNMMRTSEIQNWHQRADPSPGYKTWMEDEISWWNDNADKLDLYAKHAIEKVSTRKQGNHRHSFFCSLVSKVSPRTRNFEAARQICQPPSFHFVIKYNNSHCASLRICVRHYEIWKSERLRSYFFDFSRYLV